MTDFPKIWNSVLAGDDLPDLVATLTAEAMNDLLRVHRNKKGDKDLYTRKEQFKDEAGKALFTAEVFVGGDRAEHTAGTAKPLQIELLDAAPDPLRDEPGFSYVYDTAVGARGPRQEANAILTAQDVNFYFSWPSSTNGPDWSEHLPDIKFVMEVALHQVEVITDTGERRQGVEIEPVRLRVSKAAAAAIYRRLAEAGGDQKTQDLFFALMNYIALSVGPNLTETITFPVLEVSDYTVLPTLFRVSKSAVTFGAKLNLTARAEALATQIRGFEERFWMEVESDLHDAGKSGQIAHGQKITFPRADAFVKEYRAAIGKDKTRRSPGGIEAEVAAVETNSQIAVGMNEFLLDSVVSKFGNINKEGYTRTINLELVKGRLGYELRVGAIDISITTSGITGSTPVNAFGGLYYRLREIKKCKVRWGDEKRIGLGVKGTPKITLKTVPSNGLSVRADFELGGLKFYTGVGFPIDDILKELSKPLMDAIEAVLDTIALGISFIVVPAKFAIPGQATVLAFSRFVTAQYKHPAGGTSTRNNYAMFTATAAAQ